MLDNNTILTLMTKHFPRWMDIRKRVKKSNGGKYLQSIAEEIANIQNAIDDYKKDFFLVNHVDSYNDIPYYVYYIYVGDIQTTLLTFNLGDNIDSPFNDFYEAIDVDNFYSTPKTYLYQDNKLFFKQSDLADDIFTVTYKYDGDQYDDVPLQKLYVWNVYDEFAAFVGLTRFVDEDNEQLTKRILNVFKCRTNSTDDGLKNAIITDTLDLIEREYPHLSYQEIRDSIIIDRPSPANILLKYNEFTTVLDKLAEINRDVYRTKTWDKDLWEFPLASIDYIPHSWDYALTVYANGIGFKDDLKAEILNDGQLEVTVSAYQQDTDMLNKYLTNHPASKKIDLVIDKNISPPIDISHKIEASNMYDVTDYAMYLGSQYTKSTSPTVYETKDYAISNEIATLVGTQGHKILSSTICDRFILEKRTYKSGIRSRTATYTASGGSNYFPYPSGIEKNNIIYAHVVLHSTLYRSSPSSDYTWNARNRSGSNRGIVAYTTGDNHWRVSSAAPFDLYKFSRCFDNSGIKIYIKKDKQREGYDSCDITLYPLVDTEIETDTQYSDSYFESATVTYYYVNDIDNYTATYSLLDPSIVSVSGNNRISSFCDYGGCYYRSGTSSLVHDRNDFENDINDIFNGITIINNIDEAQTLIYYAKDELYSIYETTIPVTLYNGNGVVPYNFDSSTISIPDKDNVPKLYKLVHNSTTINTISWDASNVNNTQYIVDCSDNAQYTIQANSLSKFEKYFISKRYDNITSNNISMSKILSSISFNDIISNHSIPLLDDEYVNNVKEYKLNGNDHNDNAVDILIGNTQYIVHNDTDGIIFSYQYNSAENSEQVNISFSNGELYNIIGKNLDAYIDYILSSSIDSSNKLALTSDQNYYSYQIIPDNQMYDKYIVIDSCSPNYTAYLSGGQLICKKLINSCEAVSIKSGYYYVDEKEYYLFSNTNSYGEHKEIDTSQSITTLNTHSTETAIDVHSQKINMIKNSKMSLHEGKSTLVLHVDAMNNIEHIATNYLADITSCQSLNSWHSFGTTLNLQEINENITISLLPDFDNAYVYADITKAPGIYYLSLQLCDGLRARIAKEKSIDDTVAGILNKSLNAEFVLFDDQLDIVIDDNNIASCTFVQDIGYKYYLVIYCPDSSSPDLHFDNIVMTKDSAPDSSLLNANNLDILDINIYEQVDAEYKKRIYFDTQNIIADNADITDNGTLIYGSSKNHRFIKLIDSSSANEQLKDAFVYTNVNLNIANNYLYTLDRTGEINMLPLRVDSPTAISRFIVDLNDMPFPNMAGFEVSLYVSTDKDGEYTSLNYSQDKSDDNLFVFDIDSEQLPLNADTIYLKMTIKMPENTILGNMTLYAEQTAIIDENSELTYPPISTVPSGIGEILTSVVNAYCPGKYEVSDIKYGQINNTDLYIRAYQKSSDSLVWSDWKQINIQNPSDTIFDAIDVQYFQVKAILNGETASAQIDYIELRKVD